MNGEFPFVLSLMGVPCSSSTWTYVASSPHRHSVCAWEGRTNSDSGLCRRRCTSEKSRVSGVPFASVPEREREQSQRLHSEVQPPCFQWLTLTVGGLKIASTNQTRLTKIWLHFFSMNVKLPLTATIELNVEDHITMLKKR